MQTPDKTIISMHNAGYGIPDIAKKVGLGLGYVALVIIRHYWADDK